jgi:hypothetical protein
MPSKRTITCQDKLEDYKIERDILVKKETEDDVDLSKDIAKAEKKIAEWQAKLDKSIEADEAKEEVANAKRLAREQRDAERGVTDDVSMSGAGIDEMFNHYPRDPLGQDPYDPIDPRDSRGQGDGYDAIISQLPAQHIPSPADDEEERRGIIKKIHILEISCGYVHDEGIKDMSIEELRELHKNLAFTAKKSLGSAAALAANVYTGFVVNSPAFINLILPDYGIIVDGDALKANLNNPETRQQICDAFSEIFEDDPYLREVALKVSRGLPKLGFITMMAFMSSVKVSDQSSLV